MQFCAGTLGPEPFATVLADDVIDSETPCIRQLLDIYEFFAAPVLAVDGSAEGGHLVLRTSTLSHLPAMGQRPRVSHSQSGGKAEAERSAFRHLAIIGRYILTPDIFESIQSIEPGAGGEIQLTDSLRHLLRSRPIYAYKFEGKRYDAGDKLGFLKATVEFALQRDDKVVRSANTAKSLNL